MHVRKNMKKINILCYGIDSEDKIVGYDYILNDIFQNYDVDLIKCLPVENLDHTDGNFDVLIYHCRNPEIICHFGYSPTYEQLLSAVNKFKPKIVVQLIDEFWQEYNQFHHQIANHCNLLLKQHRHWYHEYPDNIIQIPLGYNTGFLNNKTSIKSMHDRKYTWSWTGHLKADRYEMIQEFWRIWHHVCACNGGLSVTETQQWYGDSVFVPCGRGNSSLDCWRNYEATVAGAIPVVVGPRDEIETAFKFTELPPWIYGDTWKEVVDKCQMIIDNREEMQRMQNENLRWWNRVMNHIRKKIDKAFEI